MSSTTTATTTSAPISFTLNSNPSTVSATLNYFIPPADGSKPYTIITPDPTSDAPVRNWAPQPFPAEITNIRGREDDTKVDTNGFAFIRAETAERAFEDSEEALKGYYDETIALIRRVTGAEKAVIFDHTIRRRPTVPTPDTPSTRQPVPLVHVDQTPASALARVFRHLPKEEAEQRAKRRFQIINVWRPIGHAAYDMPLALCDGRSVKPENLVPSILRYPGTDGETFLVAQSSEYQWYYLRGMTPSEVAFIKCFDSEPPHGGSAFTPHTAFEDPTTPEGVKPRESIEIRALVFY